MKRPRLTNEVQPQPSVISAVHAAAVYMLLRRFCLSNCCRINGTHIEKPCNEVLDPSRQPMADRFGAEAEAWWNSVVAEPHSFTKPVYQLGFEGQEASNVQAQGAVQISRGSVTVDSRANYTRFGDNVCMKAQVRSRAASSHGVTAVLAAVLTALQVLTALLTALLSQECMDCISNRGAAADSAYAPQYALGQRPHCQAKIP
jgi:hypothetical protein